MINKNIGYQRVLFIIIPYVFIVGVFQFIGLLIAKVDYINYYSVKTSEQHLFLAFFGLLGVFFLLWLFMKYVDKEKFINLGFHIKNRSNDILYGSALGTFIICFGYMILLLMDEIHFEEIVFNSKEVIIAILVYTIVAVAEEVLIRGYILRNLMISFNKYIALFLSSLLFSAMHGYNPNIDLFGFLNLYLAGILLGISYINTKNLWFPIALHLSWNLFQTLLGFNVSGQNVYSIIEFTILEKNIINGGDFGFEGSILSIIAQIIFIIIIWYYYYQKPISQVVS